MKSWNQQFKLYTSVLAIVLVAISTAQLSSMIALNGGITNTLYAKYSNNFDQAASLVNECAGDHESNMICVNNNPQTQGEDNVVNTPIDTTIASPRQGPPGPPGPEGPQGLQGEQGERGPPGPDKTLETIQRTSAFVIVNPGTFGSSLAECLPDEVVTGGGLNFQNINLPTTGSNVINPSYSFVRSGNGWVASYQNPGPSPITIQAFAECAKLVDTP